MVYDSVLTSVNVVIKFYSSLKDSTDIQREKFIPQIRRPSPNNNIVFILDESIRGDYLSINNPGLDTTPVLEKYFRDYPYNFYNYGIALSVATGTMLSRGRLLAGVSSIPDKDLQVFRNPLMFDIAKANGYRTINLNVQGDFPDFYIRPYDLANVDESYSHQSFGVHRSTNYSEDDFNAAEFLHERLLNDTGLFVFVEKMGTHLPYERAYPGEEPVNQIFMPKINSKGYNYTADNRVELVNSYKNAVRYNLDGFFSRLFGENPLLLRNCTIIYTSDHGQSLIEYGSLASHGGDALEVALVPFVVFSTDDYVRENLITPSKISGTLNHCNIYPTIRSILCEDLEYKSGDYHSLVSVLKWENPPLIYGYGDSSKRPQSSDINGKLILPVNKYLYLK